MSNIISLEAAQALKALGYPQDRMHGYNMGYDDWVEVTDALTALRFCAALGYNVTMEIEGKDEYFFWSCRACPKEYPVVTESEDDANTIIIAIAAHHAAHHQQQTAASP